MDSACTAEAQALVALAIERFGEAPPCSGGEQPTIEAARATLRWLVSRVERRLYRYEEICASFCRRSAAEVLRDGFIHFATPCHDLATLAGALLRLAGFRPVPVLCRIERFLRPVKFQCGLELVLAGAPYYVGFSVTTNRLAPGRFVPVRSRTQVLRAAHDAAPVGAPHLRFFGIRSPCEVDRVIEGHVLARHLRSYRRTASRRAFDRAWRRAREKFEADGGMELLGAGIWRAVGADGKEG